MSEHKQCPAVKFMIVNGQPKVVKCTKTREKHRPWHDGKHTALGQEWE